MAGTRKARVPMAEQIRLINEYRQSGMTDAGWCRENDIAVSTFYNWVSRCCMDDAVPKGKQYDYSQPGVQGVQYCNRLFAIEDSINKKYPGDYEKRNQMRLEKEKPVLEAFWSWLDQQKPVRNTRMDKAVNYVLNRRDTAETYLEDGRCSFTNNLSENAIRPFAVGRKNWLFSSSVEGANASAVVYTMVEMAKAHGLNIYEYLKFLLEHRPNKDMTDEQLAELAPWSEKLQSIKNRM